MKSLRFVCILWLVLCLIIGSSEIAWSKAPSNSSLPVAAQASASQVLTQVDKGETAEASPSQVLTQVDKGETGQADSPQVLTQVDKGETKHSNSPQVLTQVDKGETAHSNSPQVLTQVGYQTALQQLEAGQWIDAKNSLSSIIIESPSAGAYYQLAFAAARQQDTATAMWALRSSDALGGVGHSDALRTEIEALVSVDQLPLPTSSLDGIALKLGRWLGFQTLAALGLGLCWMGVWWLLRFRSRGRALAGLVLGAAALSLYLAFRQNQIAQPDEAIVTSATQVFAAPSSSAATLTELQTGASVRTGERLSGFSQVELPTGESGWVTDEVLLQVDPLHQRH